MKYVAEVKDPVATAQLMRLFGWYVAFKVDRYSFFPYIIVENKHFISACTKDSGYLESLLQDPTVQTITEKELVELIVAGKTPEKPAPVKISWSEVKVGETVCQRVGGAKFLKVPSHSYNIFLGCHSGCYGIIDDIDEKCFIR